MNSSFQDGTVYILIYLISMEWRQLIIILSAGTECSRQSSENRFRKQTNRRPIINQDQINAGVSMSINYIETHYHMFSTLDFLR